MKFSNGCWLQKEGCACFSPAEVYFTKIEKDKVVLCAPTHKINHRGDTLGGINLTVEITTPMPEVIRVKTYHYKGAIQDGPQFALNLPKQTAIDATEDDEKIVVKSGNAKLVITKENWSMTYYNGDKKLSTSAWRDLAYMKTDWKGDAYVKSADKDAYMRQQLSLGVGELIYGLGERFAAFTRNGQSIDIWNEDGGTSTDQSYKNIPFYISNKGYGVFVNHTEKVSFEVATEAVTKVEFSVPGESLDYFFFNGPDLKDVLRRYTDLTGKPALPPAWTFGLWLSTSFTTNYDEKTVMSFIDGMLDRGIPLKVFHFDCFWMKEFHWCDFEWDSRIFPDVPGMLKRYKDKGLKICVWINPYIAQGTNFFKEGLKNGYLVQRADGRGIKQIDNWQPGMGLVDFTNPDAVKWYQNKLKTLLDMGVDCFKTDFGERIPVDVKYYDGSDPVSMHNYYTYLYNKAVFDLLKEVKGEGEAILFARSATAGGQQFPVHWGGDCSATYASMAESLRGGLSFTLSGFSFWSHDMGGFEMTAAPDVYKRWLQFGLLSTHSRLHGSKSYRVPWLFDEEAVDVCRKFTKLKLRLLPYLYSMAVKSHKTGIPSMRAMIMEFNDDPATKYLDMQYMLGDSILVAPIFNKEGHAEYYLPAGKWTHLLSGEVKEGGRWYEEDYDFSSLPVFVRENTLLPIGAVDTTVDYELEKDVQIQVYEVNETASCEVVTRKGETAFTVKAVREGNKLTLEASAENGGMTYLLRNIHEIADVTGGSIVKDTENGIIIVPEGCRQEIEL